MSKVMLDLSTILALSHPPAEIQTVEEYKQYILATLSEHRRPQMTGKPGRPPKSPIVPKEETDWTDAETLSFVSGLPERIAEDILNYPDTYTIDGRVAKKLHRDQSGMGTLEYRLDNGLIADLSDSDFVGVREE